MPTSTINASMAQRREELQKLVASRAHVEHSTRSPPRVMEAIEALDRLESGSYGVCKDCGGKIPAARLKAKPEAVRCVACQASFEKRPAA